MKKQPLDNQTQWRKDFPVDMEKEEYVERREFSKFMLIISASFVVGQFYIGVLNFFRKAKKDLPIKKVAGLDELKVGEAKVFSYPEKNDTCVLVRTSKSKYVAYSNKCTHLMCPVVPKFDDKQFHCPCHQGFFDMMTGQALSGPPRRPLPRIDIQIKNNSLYAYGVKV